MRPTQRLLKFNQWLLRFIVLELRIRRSASPSQGLTLIETLVAILVMALITSAIAVPLLLSVGTRVRNQEIEQGIQVGRRQIEQARIQMVNWDGVLSADDLIDDIPILANTTDFDGTVGSAADVRPPTNVCETTGVTGGTGTCPTNTVQYMRGVDFDEDGAWDYYVQAYRTNETIVGGETQSFDVGIRVYPQDAVKADGTVITPLETEPDSAPLSSGRKNDVPLVSLYTSLYRTEN